MRYFWPCFLFLFLTGVSHPSFSLVNIEFKQAQFATGLHQPITKTSKASKASKTIKLPHIWNRDEQTSQTNGWYYLYFHLDTVPSSLLGVYVRRMNVNAEFFINGKLAKDAGLKQNPMPRYWNTPLYFTVEPNMLKQGNNLLTVHLDTANDFGMLSEIIIANDESLRPTYQTRAFVQNDITRLISIFYIVIASFFFSLWFRRRNEKAYLYLALALFTWSIASSSYFVLTPWLSTRFYLWLVYSNVIWSTIFMALVALTYIQHPVEKIKTLLFGYAFIGTIIYALTPETQLARVSAVVILASLIFAWYAIYHLFKYAFTNKKTIPFLIAISFLLLQLAGIHDWASTGGLIQSSIIYQLQLTSYVGVLFIMIITLEISHRFTQSLNATEKLNNELEQRVKQKSEALEKQYQQLQSLQQQQAITKERERIYQDLHDDVGAKILSLVYRGENNENQDIARAALQDLRDVVSRSSKTNNTLNELLADWHAEAENRLEAAGIDLDWQQQDEFDNQISSPTLALNLGRIIREAISNIIKHGNTKKVLIEIKSENHQQIISIEDFNHNIIDQNCFSGRGIANMKARSDKLNATIKWQAKPTGGCKITLILNN